VAGGGADSSLRSAFERGISARRHTYLLLPALRAMSFVCPCITKAHAPLSLHLIESIKRCRLRGCGYVEEWYWLVHRASTSVAARSCSDVLCSNTISDYGSRSAISTSIEFSQAHLSSAKFNMQSGISSPSIALLFDLGSHRTEDIQQDLEVERHWQSILCLVPKHEEQDNMVQVMHILWAFRCL
jgi:hypothetical protein